MTSKEKKVVFTLIAIFAIILIIVIIVKNSENETPNTPVGNTPTPNTSNIINTANEEKFVTQLQNGVKLNNSTELSKTKKYKNLEISNIQFTYGNGNSTILAQVKNTGTSKHERELVTISILDENNQEIGDMIAVLSELEPGETKELNATSSSNIVNAKNIEIKGN